MNIIQNFLVFSAIVLVWCGWGIYAFGWGVGVVCTVIGIAWSLIIIALAWLFYRPLIGISLLAIAGFLVWVFAFKGKDKLKELAQRGKAAPQTAPANSPDNV